MTSCWIVTEGIAGTENQCLGVAEALGVIPEIKRINLRQPWKSLSPYIGFENSFSFTGDELAPPWPELLIASGRKAVAAARYIKAKSGGKCFTVQIQDPRISLDKFDLVALPAHDPSRADNVIVTHAAPNRINSSRLEDAKQDFSAKLSKLKSPRVAVLIGGNSKAYKMTESVTLKLTQQLKALAESGYSLMVTASRRTGAHNEKVLKDNLLQDDVFYWDGSGDNPYFGLLAWADYILVTADSVSMISEAASTGKPVYLIELEGGSKRLNKFHAHLLENNIIKPFKGTLEPYTYSALNDAKLIADAIKEKAKL